MYIAIVKTENNRISKFQEYNTKAEAAALEEVLRREPDNVPALLNLGWYLILHGEGERGRDLIRRAAEIAPRDPEVRRALEAME